MMTLPAPFTDFHFLRPEWLLAVVPAVLLAVLAWRRIGVGRNPWRGLVDAHLLKHLALQETARGRRWPISALLTGWTLACLAMAGPTWQKLPTPALDHLDPTVIVLSLAQSMNAPDQNPTRLLAARHKVDDILTRMRGGQVALVIFADAPFVAAPLTEDGRVIAQMVPELATDLMPVLDDRPDLAIATAVDLLRNAGARTGRIVLIGDGTGDRPARTQEAAAAAVKAGYTVSAIGVGTPEKTPLLSYDGGTVRNRDGTVRATQMEDERLTQLARAGHGRFTRIAADDSDLDTIFAKVPGALGTSQLQNSGLSADQWLDRGPWLVIALALLASLAFRRGWIAVVLLAAGLSGMMAPRTASAAPPAGAVSTDPVAQDDVFAPPPPASGAAEPGTGSRWDNLWRTSDQQGARAFESGAYDAAARSFKDPAWQASSQYKSGDYATAASGFERQPGGDYNRGNALARAGKLEDALSAYDAAIVANPNDEDAIFNRDLVQRLLDAQKQQEKDKDKGQGQDKDKSPGSDKGDQKKPGGDDKSGQDKPGQDKPAQDKPGKDQKDQSGDQGQKQPDPKGSPADKQDKPEPKKPDPAKPDPAKSEPQKPEPAKPDPAGKPSPPAKPEPGKDAPGKPAPPQGNPPPAPPPPAPPPPNPPPPVQPPQPPPPRADQPPTTPGALARPLDEQQQNSEQALRMVPDDPTGLLRARIRSHYLGGIVPVQGVD